MKTRQATSIRWTRCLAALTLLGAATAVFAQAYNYIAPAELKQRLEAGKKPLLVDIQLESDYAQRHIVGAEATYAYPAKSDEERARLKPMVARILAGSDDVVIVCPAGGGGAKNTVDFLKSQGVPEKRLLILEKGQKGWPYAELLTQGK